MEIDSAPCSNNCTCLEFANRSDIALVESFSCGVSHRLCEAGPLQIELSGTNFQFWFCTDNLREYSAIAQAFERKDCSESNRGPEHFGALSLQL